MATIRKGILGGGSGKIGTVQMSSWKGITTIQERNLNPNTPLTNKVLAQRSKFATCRNSLSQLLWFGKFFLCDHWLRKLPAWQQWIKEVEWSWGSNPDLWENGYLISYKENTPTVEGIESSSSIHGSTLNLHYTFNPIHNNPHIQPNGLVWCRATNKWLQGAMSGDADAGYVVGSYDWDPSMGQYFVVALFFTDYSVGGRTRAGTSVNWNEIAPIV